MSVLYTPRRPRRLRLHKSIPCGRRLRRIRPAGSVGNLYATGFGNLTWRRLEAGRRLLTRQLRRSKVRVRTRLNQPLTAKSKHARMGKGKGKLRGWSGYVRPGTLMYVVEPTPRKSWLYHRSPVTRLLGIFPFNRLNYKYSGGLGAVQRSGLAPRREGNRRPRRHYPQRQRPRRLQPAHCSSRFGGTLNPWQRTKSLTQGLGFWLGHHSPEPTAALQQLLLSGGGELLRGFVAGRRRAGYPFLEGEGLLQRLLLRRLQRLRQRRRWRVVRKLLKRLPQHWRRYRRALGGLLEAWWRLLDTRSQRRLGPKPYRGLLITLQQLQLLLQRLRLLQERGSGRALRLLPQNLSSEILWPPLKKADALYQLRRLRLRLSRRRLPLTSFYPTTQPEDMEPQREEKPEQQTPGRMRRWQRRNWLIDWTVEELRERHSFPELVEELYADCPQPSEARVAAAETRRALVQAFEAALEAPSEGVEFSTEDPMKNSPSISTLLGLLSPTEDPAVPNTAPAAADSGKVPYRVIEGAAEEETLEESEEESTEESGEGSGEESGEASEEGPEEVSEEGPENSAEPAEEPRRRRRRLSPEELQLQQLLEEELQQQQLLQLEGEALPETAAPLPFNHLNLELPTLPTHRELVHWRRHHYRTTAPERWSALQRRLGAPLTSLMLRERRSGLAAKARLGGWLGSGGELPALLQRHQWNRWLGARGMTLHWAQPGGSLALGTPQGGVLPLETLQVLLQRLRLRRDSLENAERRQRNRRRRLRRRSRRRRRTKARQRRFWRLTHRRRWLWWQRRRRRLQWRWNPRLLIRRSP